MSEITSYTQAMIDGLEFNSDSSFEDCEFVGVDFTSIKLNSVSFLDCRFIRCNFANTPLVGVSLRGALFQECNLMGINWCSLTRLQNPQFRGCKMNFSTFQALKLKKMEMTDCQALEVDFSEADLSQSDFSNTNLQGANFHQSVLFDVDFRSSLNYLFDLRTAKIKGAKFSYPQVLSLITALGAVVE